MARDAGPSRRAYLTTHQVARLLGVSLPTVVNWIEAGKIAAHRTPGGHRRVGREELARFSQTYNYPLPPDFAFSSGPVRVLIADADPDFGEMLQDFLGMRGSYDILVVYSSFEAGYQLGLFQPRLVLLDLSLPGLEPRAVLTSLRARGKQTAAVRVFACTALRDARTQTIAGLFDGFIEKPIRWDRLHETLHRALS